MAEHDLIERLENVGCDREPFTPAHAKCICRLTSEAAREITRLREALTDIAVYGCGMLNQPAALNGTDEAWLRKRISEYERIARVALKQENGDNAE